MFKISGCVLLLISLAGHCAETSDSKAKPFSKDSEREKILDLISSQAKQKLQIDFLGAAKPQQRDFLKMFADDFWPLFSRLRELSTKASALHLALDRALFLNETEKKSWTEDSLKIKEAIVSLTTSEKYHHLLADLAETASGLDGELPDFIRSLHHDLNSVGFRSEEQLLLNRLDRLLSEVSAIAANSPVAQQLETHESRVKALQRKFNSGLVRFQEASEELSQIAGLSPTALGQYIGLHAKAQLNEAARIRSQLATAKGFSSWADFRIHSTRGYYEPEYATIEGRIELLQKFLVTTYQTQIEVYQAALASQSTNQMTDQNANPPSKRPPIQSLSAAEINLLLPPTDSLVEEYLPHERVNEIWQQTMLESGFGARVVYSINFDSFPRTGKNSHAYMLPVQMNDPIVFRIDARTLTVKTPRQRPGTYLPLSIFVVQNIRTDGPKGYRLAFHEGGHSLDFAHRKDPLYHGQESAYNETQAITMESFLRDRDFLFSVGVNREGERIPRQVVDEYLNNLQAHELHRLRLQALYALFDLLLWKHDFQNSNFDFVTKATQLYGELWNQYMISNGTHAFGGIDPRFSPFSTDHFYNGNVNYIGYFFAEMASFQTTEKILQDLSKTSKRRSLFKQPTLANLLTKAYYKSGFKIEFPKIIENFSGRDFNVVTYSNQLIATSKLWLFQKSQLCKFIFN